MGGSPLLARAAHPEQGVDAYTRGVDDGVPQPKPRAGARVSKGAPPRPGTTADPRRESTSGRRPTPRPSGGDKAPRTPVVIGPSDFTGDPLLVPVIDGTPIEIPKIIPAGLAEPRPGSRAGIDTMAGGPPTLLVPKVPPPPVVIDDESSGDELDEHRLALDPPREKPIRSLKATTILQRPRGPRVRRVTRIIRQVDTWSVFKVSIVFSLFLYGVCLTAGALLWQVAQNTGTVDNVQRFFESFGWRSFKLKGGTIYHNAWVGGLFLVVALTGLCVLAATMFNLITDLVGGIRVTVLEEEVIAREDRGLGWRRAATQGLNWLGKGTNNRTRPPNEPV